MPISFNGVGAPRVPFMAVEIDASQASQGPALLSYRALIIGQKTSSGTALANSLHIVTSVEQVIVLAGRGSMLHRMAIGWFSVNRSTEVWIGVLADDGAGNDAEGTITVTGPATADGTIALYIGGVRITVGVAAGDTANDIAADINTAINDATDLPVTSTVATNVATAAFRHKGLVGNGHDIRHSLTTGESLPASVGLTIAQPTGGTSNPSLTALIAAMGDIWFNVIAHPYTDATSMTAIEQELASRNGPLRMIDGLAITAASAAFSSLVTLGDSRNSPHHVIVAASGVNARTPSMERAAEVAGIVARYGSEDPARPFQTLAMVNEQPVAQADRWTLEERDQLLRHGIATTRVEAGDVVQLDRIITTYKTNAAGGADTAYLDATTLLTLMYLRFSFRARIQAKYPRHKLVDDGTRVGAGQAVITPKLGKAEALGWFREMEVLGLVENFDQFKRDLIVERNVTDRNRMDFFLPPDISNQFIVGATKIGFRL